MVSNNAEHVAVLLQDRRVVRVAEGRRRLNKRVENPRQIEGCTANDFEHVGSGRLLLERLTQFVEQARVIDGDDGLVSKCLEQCDLLVTEQPDFGASDAKHTDGLTRADQWGGQYGAVAGASRNFATLWVLTSFDPHIGDLKRSLVEDGPSMDDPTRQWQRAMSRGRPPMVGDQPENVAFHLKNRRVIGITKASRARRDLCEHAWQIRWRV
jgi:hypothetical protein